MKKDLFILLICSLLINAAYMVSLQHHKEVIEHHEMQTQNHKQDPATAAAAAAAGKATALAVKKLLDDPSNAAKIPSKFIQGQIDGLIGVF